MLEELHAGMSFSAVGYEFSANGSTIYINKVSLFFQQEKNKEVLT